jgi:hypothetical protein
LLGNAASRDVQISSRFWILAVTIEGQDCGFDPFLSQDGTAVHLFERIVAPLDELLWRRLALQSA